MADQMPRTEQRRGTRLLLVVGVAMAAVLFIAISLWPLLPGRKLGTAETNHGTLPQTAAVNGRGAPAQSSAQSNVGRSDPARPEDQTGGKARDIKQSSQPLALSDAQRGQVRDIFARAQPNRVESVDFEIMIGAAVPRQTTLQDLPPEVTGIMNGYWGDQYVMVRDTLVIVDHQSRRVVAIVPGVA